MEKTTERLKEWKEETGRGKRKDVAKKEEMKLGSKKKRREKKKDVRNK